MAIPARCCLATAHLRFGAETEKTGRRTMIYELSDLPSDDEGKRAFLFVVLENRELHQEQSTTTDHGHGQSRRTRGAPKARH